MKKTHLPDKNSLNLNVTESTLPGLAGRFLYSPFSVLRSGDGEWLQRKRQWLSLGIESEIGRGENITIRDPMLSEDSMNHYRNENKFSKVYNIGNKEKWDAERKGLLHKGNTINTDTEKWEGGRSAWQNVGTSIFDPVLCELMYAWFCPKGGQVVDPFAGGSVRGVVAAKMGLKYWGSELREEQVQANIVQGEKICKGNQPVWVCGDAARELRFAPDADFIFSCPPYGNLEVYSTMEEDLSNKTYNEFIDLYENIIYKACKALKKDRFACFVVGNFRDKKTGFYYNLVGDTVQAFEQCNTILYNDAVLVTPTGSLPVRAGKQFHSGRKMGKTHQNILVFYKGDPRKIKENFNHEEV